MQKTRVLGVGNILLQDEGIGVQALECLRACYHLPRGVQALDGGVLGLDLLPYIEGVDNLLILDAIETGQAPGTLLRLEGDAIHARLALKMSIHQVGLQEVLATLALQGKLPARVVLWGVQPASLDWGVELSPAVAMRLNDLVDAAAAELCEWGLAVRRTRTAATSCAPAHSSPLPDSPPDPQTPMPDWHPTIP
jgi:hydrogenase maturation protease